MIELFKQIDAVFQPKEPLQQVIQKLEGIDKQSYEGFIHSYCLPIGAEITEDQFWKMIKCKARKGSLVVNRIAKCKLIKKTSQGFIREIMFTNNPSKMLEEVQIDESSKTVLFIMQPPQHFVAINKVIEIEGKLYFQGTYFDESVRSPEEFAESAQSMLKNMQAFVLAGKMESVFNKYYG